MALSTSQAAYLLQSTVDTMKHDFQDYQPNPMLIKALDYSNRFATNKNKEILDEMSLKFKDHYHLDETEFCQLTSLAPTTVEEAVALIPSMKRFDVDDVEKMLREYESYREFE
jgi:DNA-directed RNA polymerase II subunit RPB4